MTPLCWGPCSQKLLEGTPDDFKKFCNYEGVRITIEEKINDFYEQNILKKQSKN